MVKSFLIGMLAFGTSLFADGAVVAPAQPQNWSTMILLVFGLVLFYFLLWRPEQKRRKAAEKQRNSLKKGDRVTAIGIIGTVSRVQDQTVILEMYDGKTKIEVLKNAISDVQSVSQDTEKAEDSKRVELATDNKS